jgi:DNA-binding response OmpR family regulator
MKRNFRGIARKKALGPKCFVKPMRTSSSSFNQLVVHLVGRAKRSGVVLLPHIGGTPYACSSSLIAGEIVLLSLDKSAEDIHSSSHLIFIFLPYNRGMQILIVEDEAKIRHFLRRGLLEESYAVDTAEDGEEALYKLDINAYDLVLLDIMLPKVNGIAVCQALREKGSHVLIILLTAKDQVTDKVLGLDAGADDYITKPFSFDELTARIRAIFRREKKADATILAIGDLSLDPATKTAKRGKQTIVLTTREYALLEYFLRNPQIVLTKTQILEHVWDYNYDGLSNIVETYVKYLRKKLKTTPHAPELIHTMRGSGYILRED